MIILNVLSVFFAGANYLTFVFLIMFVLGLIFKLIPSR